LHSRRETAKRHIEAYDGNRLFLVAINVTHAIVADGR